MTEVWEGVVFDAQTICSKLKPAGSELGVDPVLTVTTSGISVLMYLQRKGELTLLKGGGVSGLDWRVMVVSKETSILFETKHQGKTYGQSSTDVVAS